MVYHGLEDLGSLLFAGNQLVGLFLFSKTAEIEEITLKRNWTKKDVLKNRYFSIYLTIRPVARKGYGSIAHEAKPNGLLTRGP